jgi:hypothetical protein
MCLLFVLNNGWSWDNTLICNVIALLKVVKFKKCWCHMRDISISLWVHIATECVLLYVLSNNIIQINKYIVFILGITGSSKPQTNYILGVIF